MREEFKLSYVTGNAIFSILRVTVPIVKWVRNCCVVNWCYLLYIYIMMNDDVCVMIWLKLLEKTYVCRYILKLLSDEDTKF
jgi:hypothetical protein